MEQINEDELFVQLVQGKITKSAYETHVKYKVGQRVRGIGEHDGERIDGLLGTIKLISEYSDIGVEWDEKKHWMHDLNKLSPDERGWFVRPRNLKFIEDVVESEA